MAHVKKTKLHRDTFFLGIIATLLLVGIFLFISASLGILESSSVKFKSILFNQLVFGIGGGIIALFVAERIDYKFWRKYSFFIYVASIILTALVFVPGLGFAHGGASRWLAIGGFSFQPVEVLKVGYIMYFSAWLSSLKARGDKIDWPTIMPLAITTLIALGILIKQPDTKNIILLALVSGVLLFIGGISWKKIGIIFGGSLLVLTILVMAKPYLRERIHTFLDPEKDPQGSSFQIRQSLIAIGSGQIFGTGLGQSVQKFTSLPEPQGDSIFAVAGEEFGFLGTTAIVILFVMFALRGLRIARRAPDTFSSFLVTGFVVLIVSQSFMNIAALIGLFPLTGVPLVFISHGGSALLIALATVGIILQISGKARGEPGR